MVTTKKKLQDAATAAGTGITFTVSGYPYAVFQAIGTFVGTITFQATLDGSNWHNILLENLTTGVLGTTTTATGLYKADTIGLSIVRANITAYTSGSITVVARGAG